jgi:hypothetical protein
LYAPLVNSQRRVVLSQNGFESKSAPLLVNFVGAVPEWEEKNHFYTAVVQKNGDSKNNSNQARPRLGKHSVPKPDFCPAEDDVVCCQSPFRQSKIRKPAARRSHKTRRKKDENQVPGRSVDRVAFDGGGNGCIGTRSDASGEGQGATVSGDHEE